MRDTGLRSSDFKEMNQFFSRFDCIEKVVLFGSRAKGTFKNGSDVDLAIMGENASVGIAAKLSYWLNEESRMPYSFDVLNFETIENQNLIDHIHRVGICIYSKK